MSKRIEQEIVRTRVRRLVVGTVCMVAATIIGVFRANQIDGMLILALILLAVGTTQFVQFYASEGGCR